MNQLEKEFEGLSVSGWKRCGICDGKYPLQKHNFEECYSLDFEWDLKRMDYNQSIVDIIIQSSDDSILFKIFNDESLFSYKFEQIFLIMDW